MGLSSGQKSFVQNVLRRLHNLSRVTTLPRVVFLRKCLLELRDCVLRITGICCGGFLETFFKVLSRLIIRFLPNRAVGLLLQQ